MYNMEENDGVVDWPTDQEYTLYNTKTNTLFVSEIKLMLIYNFGNF